MDQWSKLRRKRPAETPAAAGEVAKSKTAVAGKRQAGMPPPPKAARLDATSLANIKAPGRAAATKPKANVSPQPPGEFSTASECRFGSETALLDESRWIKQRASR